MKKTFNFGKIDFYGTGRKINLVTITAELNEKENGKPVFTASGEVWNNIKSDIVCGGQCLDILSKYVKNPLFKRINKLWNLYHLNDMNAGTPDQENAIEQWKVNGNKYDYTAACEYLKSINLYEVEHEGKPYKYGHKWIYASIPENDLQDIKNLLINE